MNFKLVLFNNHKFPCVNFSAVQIFYREQVKTGSQCLVCFRNQIPGMFAARKHGLNVRAKITESFIPLRVLAMVGLSIVSETAYHISGQGVNAHLTVGRQIVKINFTLPFLGAIPQSIYAVGIRVNADFELFFWDRAGVPGVTTTTFCRRLLSRLGREMEASPLSKAVTEKAYCQPLCKPSISIWYQNSVSLTSLVSGSV